MEVMLLNDKFLDDVLIEKYESFIWTERYQQEGDFELLMSKEDSDSSPLEKGRYLAINKSHRIMVIDTNEETISSDGEKKVIWRGLSLESWFRNRTIMPTKLPRYVWTGKPYISASQEIYHTTYRRMNLFDNPYLQQWGLARYIFPGGDPEVTAATATFNDDGSISLSGLTVAAAGTRKRFGVESGDPQNYRRIPIPSTARTFGFSIEVSGLDPIDKRTAGYQIALYNSSKSMLGFATGHVSEDGLIKTTFTTSGVVDRYRLHLWISNGDENKGYHAITDASAKFSKPSLYHGTTYSPWFAGDSTYLELFPERQFEDDAGQIINTMLNDTVVNNTDAPWENLPLTIGFPPYVNGYVDNPLEPPVETATLSYGPSNTLYDAITNASETYDLGFYIMRNPDTGQLYTGGYAGTNRTLGQETSTPVVFSPDLGTLNDPTKFSSIRDKRDLAVVYGKTDMVICDIFGNTADALSITGIERRVISVDGTSIDLPRNTAELRNALIQLGREKLNQHSTIQTFEGQTPEFEVYKYEEDFAVGSMVTISDGQGFSADMRVSEYIFVSDAEGSRSYPTLSLNKYIEPGTWESLKPSYVWDIATGTWIEQ